MSDRALVTGGAGFVGKALTAALRARGVRVRVLDPKADECDPDAIAGSILDEQDRAAALDGVDVVYHLAGVADLWARDPSVFERINIEGTRAMLAAAREAGARTFVYCSSLTTLIGRDRAIGPSSVDETSEVDPAMLLGPYPRSKREGEMLARAAASDGFRTVIAMPTEPLGPGDEGPTPPTQMILDFLNGRTPAYIDCMLNFVPVDSLAEGLIACAQKGRGGERYLLGGENVAMRDLLAALERLSGRATPKTRLPYAVALAAGVVDTQLVARLSGKAPKAPLTGVRLAGRQASFSSSKAADELGWRAGPVEPALAALVTWARETGRLA